MGNCDNWQPIVQDVEQNVRVMKIDGMIYQSFAERCNLYVGCLNNFPLGLYNGCCDMFKGVKYVTFRPTSFSVNVCERRNKHLMSILRNL